jgi:hypothetical protein
VQRLRHRQLSQFAGGDVDVARAAKESLVEQHAHRLDRVQRHALGTREDTVARVARKPRNETLEQLRDRIVAQRLERERRRVARRRPVWMAVVHVGPRERDNEQLVVARPLEQVLDELEQRRVGPLHVLEHEHDGMLLRQPLEEEAPRAEEVFLLAHLPVLLETEQVCEARLDPLPLLVVEDELGETGGELLARGACVLAFGDVEAFARHLRQRPVRDAVAVREAAAAVPVRELGEAVQVLVEFPREARLADAGDAEDGDEVRAALLGGGVVELLDEPELAVAADERRLEALGAAAPADAGGDAQRAPERDLLGLALQVERACVLVHDRGLARAPRRLADEHRAGLRRRLHARGGVDEVAGDETLTRGAERHRGFAREDARSCAQARVERCDGFDEIERRANGAFGVVLARGRRAPHRHDCVADELLHHAAIASDDEARGVEVAREETADVLRVA